MAKRKSVKKLPLPAAIALLVIILISAVFEKTGIWDKIEYLVDGDAYSVNVAYSGEGVAASIHFIDVGQGDCTLIISDDEAMLIDSGEAEYSNTVIKTLRNFGVSELDYIVATHAHSDHIGGMADIIDAIPTENLILSRPTDDSMTTKIYTDMIDAAEENDVNIITATAGHTFTMGYTGCSIISPFNTDSSEENNNSIVMHITAGTTSLLMTGDAESKAEKAILQHYPAISADILKAGHHGSKTSSSANFLAAVSPEVAIIHVGANNSYNHPSKEVVDAIGEYTDAIYRTDRNGIISVYCFENNYTIETQW